MIRNIGIFAHVDAGKTTLTEQILLKAGFIRKAGSVDSGTTYTDSLPVERRRGITVKSAGVTFEWKGTRINLIDTPGHSDFSSEVERSMWALDAAVLVVDAVEGVQPQTIVLGKALKAAGLPYILFINKLDRPIADPDKAIKGIRKLITEDAVLMDDKDAVFEAVCTNDEDIAERWLCGEELTESLIDSRLAQLVSERKCYPVMCGSALKGEGITDLLDAVIKYLPSPDEGNGELCALAFASINDTRMGRGLWVRVFSGSLSNRMAIDTEAGFDPVTSERITVQSKITRLKDASFNDVDKLGAGEVGIVYGLGSLKIGNTIGNNELLPRSAALGSIKMPLIKVRVIPDSPENMDNLRKACEALSLEDPLLKCEYVRSLQQLNLHVMGTIQLEIIEETLRTEYGLNVSFSAPAVIYKETLAKETTGFVAYTMPKPCWAILEFNMKPAPRGSGVSFTSIVAPGEILPRYQNQVKQALNNALAQGRLGWEVTDIEITLTGGSHHQFHTHPLDFIVATPMGIQDGLQRGGSVLLEPILELNVTLPSEHLGRFISDVNLMRGETASTLGNGDYVNAIARVPVSTSLDYSSQLAAYTSGRGTMSATLFGYRECPLEKGSAAQRRGVDPLDTAKYILAARNALENDIFDY